MIDPDTPSVASAEPTATVRVDAPTYYAGNIQIISTPNEVSIIFGRAHPQMSAGGQAPNFSLTIEAQVIVQLSPQTAKELLHVLKQQVQFIEADNGVITTPFLRDQEGQ